MPPKDPAKDRAFDSAYQLRSLSEQLRVLERELSRVSGQIEPPVAPPMRLPTCLGRPIGVTPVEFPSLASLTVGANARTLDPAVPTTRGPSFGRTATIACASLLLLGTTAILPPLIWRYVEHAETSTPELQPAEPQSEASLRTEGFAQSARQLGNIRLVSAPAEPERHAVSASMPAPSRVTTTLTVPESELASLHLPAFVSDVGPARVGSAVMIEGLPADARVSHGIRIAPDSWCVGAAFVAHAVLSLPRNTPERLDVSVRVVAADSQELAANDVQIRVLRSADRTAPVIPRTAGRPAITAAVRPAPLPTSRFEPAAGQSETALDIVAPPSLRPAVAPGPAKPPARPPATSGWILQTIPAEQTPSWAPFGNRHSQ